MPQNIQILKAFEDWPCYIVINTGDYYTRVIKSLVFLRAMSYILRPLRIVIALTV